MIYESKQYYTYIRLERDSDTEFSEYIFSVNLVRYGIIKSKQLLGQLNMYEFIILPDPAVFQQYVESNTIIVMHICW